ncbi:MAG: ParB N-terminal domain-containing protein [Archangiaceae bacterium]|nr:ParB N-terminal domain-containing protein [Archangiaceae bacterium]
MSDVTNTENATTPDGSPPGESSAVLVTPEPAVAEAAVEASSVKPEPDTIDDDGLSDDEDPAETEDDEIDVEPHEVPRHFSAPALLPIERLSSDQTFCVRSAAELEDVTALATDIARLGQLFPIDVRLVAPDTIQIVTGFRRVAALKFLQREKVVARLHTELSDTDAMLMAIASAIHGRSVSPDALRAVQEQLESQGKLIPAARDMIAKALATDDELSPENVEEEVDADELAADVTLRLSQCNQDLSLLADVFDQLDDEKREALLTQLKYSIDLVAFLESKK